jgi:small subunit ribosomal protein S6
MYELTYIINPVSADLNTAQVAEKVRNQIKELGGETKKEYISEKKKLAYEIKKQSFGFYATAELEMEPEKIDELNNFLKLDNDVLRHLIINLAELRTQKVSTKPARVKPAIETADTADESTAAKTGKVKIEELDKKLEELLKE